MQHLAATDCMAETKPFYTQIYQYVFEKAFSNAVAQLDVDTVHDITPSVDELKEMHNKAGDYNCFININKNK
jgi:hypothetical protein